MRIHESHPLRICAGLLLFALPLFHCSVQSQPLGGQPTGSAINALKAKKVCVAVFASGDGGSVGERTAQARLENILMDNSVTTLDQAKADELKKNWRSLIKADYIVTGDDWVKFAKQYEISAIFRVYVSADAAPGLADYYSGTAKADVRVVMENAQVHSVTSVPMGTRGNPPCDGLTRDSALKNALEVALDDACQKLGCAIADPAKARSVSLVLTGPVSAPAGEDKEPERVAENSMQGMLQLKNETWAKEKLSCAAKSPDGGVEAVGGYVDDIDFHRRPPMIRGARVHLVDLNSKQELPALECYAIEKKEMTEKGERIISDCMFLGSWRYVAAVSGSDVFLWDTETGKRTSQRFDREMKNAKLAYRRGPTDSYLVIKSSKASQVYKIERKQ